MKQIKITIITALILLTAGFTCKAQQEILYTQYVYNELTINPAYAGYHEALNVSLNTRKQWLGLEGAPVTLTLAGHAVVNNRNPECDNFSLKKGRMRPTKTHKQVGLGAVIFNDRIGVDNTWQANFSYSYKIVSKEHRLSFGLQSSVQNYSQIFSDLEQYNGEDDVFSQNIGKTMFNFGAGLFFDHDRYYVGFSVPQILENYLDDSRDEDNRQLRQYFLTGGYLFFLNKYYKLKPSFMFRYTEELPFQVDINAMVIYDDKIYYGISYRNKQTVSAIFQVHAARRIRVGLAYDYILSDFKKVTNGSVEVLLNYNLRNPVQKVVNPRYF